MKNFAKLFDHPEYGQILVMIDQDKDGPVVKFCTYPRTLRHGMCYIVASFGGDPSDAWESARKTIEAVDVDRAGVVVAPLFD